MKGNNYASRSNVFAWLIAGISFLFITPLIWADAAMPPPTMQQAIHTTPDGRSINGYDFGNGFRARISDGLSQGGHYGKANYVGGQVGGVLHGTKRLNTLLTDTHGATARGTITTTTQLPSGNTLANLGGALIAGQVMGSGIQRAQTGGIADAIADGNYGEAARIASASVADAVYAGAFSGINNIINDVQSKKADAVAAVARAQAEAAAAAASNIMPDGNAYVVAVRADDIHSEPIKYISVPSNHSLSTTGTYASYDPRLPGGIFDAVLVVYSGGRPWGTFSFPNINPLNSSGFSSTYYIFGSVRVTPQNINVIKSKLYGIPQPAPSDFFATESEIAAALLEAMNRNTQALTDVVNAISAAGGLNQINTTTTVDNGGTAQTTFLTSPYTPQGSDQAQQTQFVINKDGSVTATTISRPDLAANTSQAPTRAPVGVVQTAPTIAPKETATAEAPDICANNPNSLMCAEVGSSDYEDPVVPEKSIDVNFSPADIFSTDGICPAAEMFEILGTTREFSFEPACDGARKIRPIAIASVIVMCSMFAFAAVKEL